VILHSLNKLKFITMVHHHIEMLLQSCPANLFKIFKICRHKFKNKVLFVKHLSKILEETWQVHGGVMLHHIGTTEHHFVVVYFSLRL
jgi:hypothetical protein